MAWSDQRRRLVLPVLSCVSQSMDRGVPAYHFAAIGAKPPFVSLVLHVPNMAHLQFPIASSYGRFQDQSQQQASRVQTGASRRSGARIVRNPVAPGRNPKRKTTTTHIHHVSCSQPPSINAQPTPQKAAKRQSARNPEQRMCLDVRMHSRTLVTPCVTIGTVFRRSGESRSRGGYLVVWASVGGSCEAESHFGDLANNVRVGERESSGTPSLRVQAVGLA